MPDFSTTSKINSGELSALLGQDAPVVLKALTAGLRPDLPHTVQEWCDTVPVSFPPFVHASVRSMLTLAVKLRNTLQADYAYGDVRYLSTAGDIRARHAVMPDGLDDTRIHSYDLARWLRLPHSAVVSAALLRVPADTVYTNATVEGKVVNGVSLPSGTYSPDLVGIESVLSALGLHQVAHQHAKGCGYL